MVDNDLFSPEVAQVKSVRSTEPDEMQVATDGGWLLKAKEEYEHLSAVLAAEQEDYEREKAEKAAQAFQNKIKSVLGLDVEVTPGTRVVVIDGLRFSNGTRENGGSYALNLWQPCKQCGENHEPRTIHNTGDVIGAAQFEGTFVCDDCLRKEWSARYRASGEPAATPEPTPLETLGAALVAYFKSEMGGGEA